MQCTGGCYDSTHEVDLSCRLPFSDNAFGAIACVGTLTYLSPESSVLAEFVRLTEPGGTIAYNLRTDHAPEWASAHEALLNAGKWQLLEQSKPLPYLPDNPDYGTKVKTVVYTWQVL